MANNQGIEIYSEIKNLNEEYYFKDLLSKCYKKEIIEDKYLSKIYNDRLEALKIKLKYYTKDESSSVMVEIAENILKGIDYTIGIYLKSINSIEDKVESLKSISLEEIIDRGNRIIKEKFIVCNEQLKEMQKNKLNIDNYSYKDTLGDGLSMFFNEYNDFFTPHEAPCSVDYQLCIDNMMYVGIEYIETYLNSISLENEFCNKFNIEEIEELLRGYDINHNLLLINIFEIVLTNSIGLIICGKDPMSLNISNIDRTLIKEKLYTLNIEELKIELQEYVDKLCKLLDLKNTELMKYINKALLKLIPFIKNNIEIDMLEKVFLSFIDKDSNYIEYIDKGRISNKGFRRITEKIRSSESIDEKISLIKNNIESLEDLIDMLDSECLFDKEFDLYFRSLSQFEVVLIFKYISDISLDNIYNREWYLLFNNYIDSLKEDEKVVIKEISKKVILS